jgi:predicted butyrate kinase (DUF1464 family)
MPRVIGIDPGTVSIDLFGLADGQVFLDRSIPTGDALASPALLTALLEGVPSLDLVAGPSGYGLPLTRARDLTETDLRLAYLAAEGEQGGIGGLRALMRALRTSAAPVVLTPGVVHLPTVPAHRKVNRVDMGTADKVCACALAVFEQSTRVRCAIGDTSFILLELGGAFTAALAVQGGAIVDGAGGSSGPLGVRAAGALDGEVAYLAGEFSKALLFQGGAASIAAPDDFAEGQGVSEPARTRLAWDAFVESAAKAVAMLRVAVPHPREILLSGRLARVATLRARLEAQLATVAPSVPVRELGGFSAVAKHAAQGAALIADGLAGGQHAQLVEHLGIREASGTALDHLYVISPGAARARLGID